MPFTEIQEEIKAKAPEAYSHDLDASFYDADYWRIREVRNGLVIINGKVLVRASQTLESMQAINAVTNTPIIRPVVLRISWNHWHRPGNRLPWHFYPAFWRLLYHFARSSKTNPKIKNAESMEARMDVEGLKERAVAGSWLLRLHLVEKDEVDDDWQSALNQKKSKEFRRIMKS